MPKLVMAMQGLQNRSQHTCYCEICNKVTREGKPLCPDHILERGRARRLYEIVEEAEREVDRVRFQGPSAVNINGLIVREILAGLKNAGKRTWRRIVKDYANYMNDSEVARCYLERLIDEGLVRVFQPVRTYEVVDITQKGLDSLEPFRVD